MDGTDGSLPFEALVETVGDGLFVLDDEDRVAWTNDAFRDLAGDGTDPVGRDFASLLGDGSGTFVPEAAPDDSGDRPPDLDGVANPDLDALTNGDGPTRVTIQGADGPWEVHLRRLPDGRAVGRLRDVSGRFHRERELERYRTVFDAVVDAIYVLDEERRFRWVNDAFVRMLGHDRETILDTPVTAFLTEEQVAVSNRNVEYLLSEDTADLITFEMEVRRADGTTFPAETRATLLPGDGFAGTVGVVRDVSDRKERERELERRNERLDAFASLVSHDLRNPLNVAVGRLELARAECDSQHLEHVANAHDRMDALIGDLLTFARASEAGTDVTPVDLEALAESSWANVETGATTLAVDVERSIGADRGGLAQLLENLFRNAVEYGGDVVTVGTLDDGFYVADDGPGIDPEERDRVLDSGYSTAPDGTGLGLSIVAGIADAHDWSVRVTEGAAGGARFEFTGVEFPDG